jgi:hypothetical protein
MSASIVYRATVDGVSCVDVVLDIIPDKDGEDPVIRTTMGNFAINVPGAANGDDVGDVLRAFGALIGIKGAIKITIEPDVQ